MSEGRVGLLFGGRSVEHEVSVVSARGVSGALRRAGLACVPLGVTGDGVWLGPAASQRVLEGAAARVEPDPGDAARVFVAPGGGLVLSEGRDGPVPLDIDVLFPLVHGWGGEDGKLQGAVELAGLPYVGAGVLGSALAMDKSMAKRIFREAGLPVVPWIDFDAADPPTQRAEAEARVGPELGYPVFVKPANGGSSVGVSRVSSPQALPSALDEAFACDRRVLVEKGLDAREIECAVVGNERPAASVLGEILPSREFYDYAAKYLDGTSGLVIPADLGAQASESIRDLALRAYRAADLAGFARVDFLVERQGGRPYLNEINTLPGFTPISMFPKLWEASGVPYPELVKRLVGLASERALAERGRRTRYGGSASPPETAGLDA